YLLSLSQFWASLGARLRGRSEPIADLTALGYGILAAVVLQVGFSQWSVMNYLFSTAPLNFNQALTCMAAALPMTLVAMLANWLNPQD
ncbi:MAG: hypothetical protein ACKO21_03980, partial [Nodosilinea sp.]